MRTPPPDPWNNEVDDGWRELVVASSPPPAPPSIERTASPELPNDLCTWQSHGQSPSVEMAAFVEAPSVTAADRRLWIVAGALMGMAGLVLALLGVLTFGKWPSSAAGAAVTSPPPRAAGPATAAPSPAAAPSPTTVPSRSVASGNSAVATATARPASGNPRLLRRANHARHHKHAAR